MKLKSSIVILLISICLNSAAQKNKPSKYPSLLWEITGNGLKKPSYLFGTMHVSNKLAFHLSDSFYYAIKNCDVVGLELNPQSWQVEMANMQDAQIQIRSFAYKAGNDYINKESFKIEEFDKKLKYALSDEPQQVNSLLYRSYSQTADFEENTYLDLYIYQTGRKLGKAAAGMEDYLATEQLILEAYQDMAKEKKKKKIYTENESVYDIAEKIQDAYRRGDLDLLDSLEKKTSQSDAFTEKFLYKRNEIQANSIDTIIKNRSLFVGVGAAHLPGNRGVIELLRKMGYKLRPIKMQDRDAEQKELIDKMKVPVAMQSTKTEDEMISLQMPGKLYKRYENRLNESWQYADMENGSYYMINRVKTNAALFGLTEKQVLKKIDSFLYENIPGKIISKKEIIKNGYIGYDITNKTRRNDVQRYNIFVTPFEVLIIKMSGNDDYVNGKEAEQFFASIQLKENKFQWKNYTPNSGGFNVMLPQVPYVFVDKNSKDFNDTWQYNAIDKETGNVYSIFKKNIHNYNFIEEDSFDVSLIEESFLKSDIIEKRLSRKQTNFNGYAALDLLFATKNGEQLKAKAIIKGSNYYLLTALANKKNIATTDKVFNSFSFTNFNYNTPQYYSDTSLKFTVKTSIIPKIDSSIKILIDQTLKYEKLNRDNDIYNSWISDRYAVFNSDTTGESIAVTVKTFADYYDSRDTIKFWKNEIRWKDIEEDFIVEGKEYYTTKDSICGYKYNLLDTNSNRKIKVLTALKNNRLFTLSTLIDAKAEESNFIKTFFATFSPEKKSFGPSVFTSKLNEFFEAYYSKDTTTKKRANSALSYLYYGEKGFPKIKEAISKLTLKDKDYFEIKEKFINELGYIDDSTCVNDVINYLKQLHTEVADTATFQNPIVKALFRLSTKKSFAEGKELLLQDPPVFDNNESVNEIFDLLNDSLPLTKTLFPEILQLASLEDYKHEVNDLLIDLVDSNYLKGNDYENYFSKLFFDAKIELKKQQLKDEKVIDKKEDEQEDEENTSRRVTTTRSYKSYVGYKDYAYAKKSNSELEDYAILLMPFYDKNVAVQKFFDKLLQSKNNDLKISTITLMLRNDKKINDTILKNIAAKESYKVKLYQALAEIKKANLFPTDYINQEAFAKSILLNETEKEKFYATEIVKKQTVELKNKKGVVYFFKYKMDKDEEWQLGISGLQPINVKEVDYKPELVYLSGKKFSTDKTELEQFEQELKELIFAKRKSARNFFTANDYGGYGGYDD